MSTAAVGNSYDLRRLLTYVASLELEINRERRHAHYVRRRVRQALKSIQRQADDAKPDEAQAALADAGKTAKALAQTLRELREPPGYHPAHDQAIDIAVRPLAEQVFRWQQRLAGADEVELRLELAIDHVEWFPARLRHILDNLIANAFKHRDASKAGSWMQLAVRETESGYEFRLSDNGLGLSAVGQAEAFDLFPLGPGAAAGMGVGMAVAKLLVEQSDGTLTVESGEGQGATFTATLPRYELEDFLV